MFVFVIVVGAVVRMLVFVDGSIVMRVPVRVLVGVPGIGIVVHVNGSILVLVR